MVSNICYFYPDLWGDDPIWRSYFAKGLVQPPTSLCAIVDLLFHHVLPSTKTWKQVMGSCGKESWFSTFFRLPERLCQELLRVNVSQKARSWSLEKFKFLFLQQNMCLILFDFFFRNLCFKPVLLLRWHCSMNLFNDVRLLTLKALEFGLDCEAVPGDREGTACKSAPFFWVIFTIMY